MNSLLDDINEAIPILNLVLVTWELILMVMLIFMGYHQEDYFKLQII